MSCTVQLNAHTNYLEGAISNSSLGFIGRLTSRLYIHGNRISGTIPFELGRLFNGSFLM